MFYDPGAHYDCHETVDEPVRDKERANFCGSFLYKQTDGKTGPEPDGKSRAGFDALFK
jgi:hypothetical protein